MTTRTTYTTNGRRAALCVAAMLMLCLSASAQNGFNMPFSQFGVGLTEMPFNTGLAQRTGGTMLTRSSNNYVNPFNPASYAGVETESFVFDMGLNLQMATLRDANNSAPDFDGTLGYITLAMPITKWWKLAAGLMPYTQVDYSSVSTQSGEGFGQMKTVYDGTGGVNQVFLGSAFNIPAGKGRKLQVGFNANYLTGSIDRAISYRFLGNDSTFYANSRRYKSTRVSNLTVDLGLQAWQELNEHLMLGVGLVYKPYMDMTVNDLALIYTYATDESLMDTVFPARGSDAEFKSRLEQAQTFAAGLSLTVDKHWVFAADATLSQWNNLRYTEDAEHAIFGSSAIEYGSTSRYSASVEKMVNMDAATYWGRIGWSLGAHTQQGTLWLNIDGSSTRLDSWGVGGGLMLPMRKGRSQLTLSAYYTSLGTPQVLQRNCFTLGISVSSCDRWFVKRKYN